MWGEVALQKVSETPAGEELFVIVLAGNAAPPGHHGWIESGQMSEAAITRLLGGAGRPLADIHAMVRVARQVFKAKAKRAAASTDSA
jgi:hypothetical protein